MTAVTDALRYDGYGVTIDADGGFGSPWKFQGALDVAPGSEPLYDIGARLYPPSLGSWTSLDTVTGGAQDPLSMNRFLYAEANPATLIDPTGHYAQMGEDICPSCVPGSKPVPGQSAASTSYKPVRNPSQPNLPAEDYDRYTHPQTASGGTAPTPASLGDMDAQTTLNTRNLPLDLIPRAGGLCLSATALAGLGVTTDACVSVPLDDLLYGKAAFVVGGGPIGGGGLGGSVTVGPMVSNSRRASDYNGLGGTFGGSVGEDVVVSGDVSLGRTEDGYTVVMGQVGAGVGFSFAPPGVPAEMHAGGIAVQAIEFDPGMVMIPGNPWIPLRAAAWAIGAASRATPSGGAGGSF